MGGAKTRTTELDCFRLRPIRPAQGFGRQVAVARRAMTTDDFRGRRLSNAAPRASSPDPVPPPIPSATQIALLLAGPPVAGRLSGAADGPARFADHCASCPGMEGHARTPAGRKLHAKGLTLSRLTPPEIEHEIREGQKDSRGQTAMPPLRDQLAPDETKALTPVVVGFRK